MTLGMLRPLPLLSAHLLRKRSKGLRPQLVSQFTLRGLYFYFILLKAVDVLTQLTPALHGLYRAIISTSYPWSLSQWEQLTIHLNMLVAPEILDRLHRLLIDINQEEHANVNVIQFIQTFLARYISRSRPLSGYFLVCCVIETQWTALAQALAPAQSMTYGNIVEAAAANKAWLFLMRTAASNLQVTDETIRGTLKMTLRYAMQCFTDLLDQIEEMDSDPSIDTYAWETMSESLVRYFI